VINAVISAASGFVVGSPPAPSGVAALDRLIAATAHASKTAALFPIRYADPNLSIDTLEEAIAARY
jgi:hypothetical protein